MFNINILILGLKTTSLPLVPSISTQLTEILALSCETLYMSIVKLVSLVTVVPFDVTTRYWLQQTPALSSLSHLN